MWFIYNGILFSHKRKCPLRQQGQTWTLLYRVKQVRERQVPYDVTYMWNLKYDTSELIYKTETDSQIQKTNL